MIRQATSDDGTVPTAVGCFCLVDDEVLLVQRQRGKHLGLLWAVPAGKLDAGENDYVGMARELAEEVGLSIEPLTLTRLNDQVVSGDDQTFRFISFVIKLDRKPHLLIKADEIRAAAWVPLARVAKRNVVPHFWDGIRDLYCWLSFNAVQPTLFLIPERSSGRGMI